MKTTHFISVLFITAFLLVSMTTQAQTVDLFNGTNLDGWGFVLKDNSKKAEEVFTVKEGVIHITGSPFGYMYTQKEYSNFHLYVEWNWPQEATNSGIFLFVQDEKKVWPNAVECQLQAGNAGDFVLLAGSNLAEFVTKPGEQRPAFPVIKKKEASSEVPVGEWNNADITCQNGTITVYINGILQNRGSQSLHQSGRIALQSEGKNIQFRRIRVTPL